MSQGLIDPTILEVAANQRVLPSVLIAPSLVLKEAWESQHFKNFYSLILNNLLESQEDLGHLTQKPELKAFLQQIQLK